MTSSAVTIVLELDAADRPCGVATASGRAPQEFHGWLGLAVAITALAGRGDCCGRDDGAPAHPNEGASR